MDEAGIGGKKDNENDFVNDDIGNSNNNIIINTSLDIKVEKKNSKNKNIQKKGIKRKKCDIVKKEEDDIPPAVLMMRGMRIFFYLVIWVFPSYLAGRFILYLWDKWYNTGGAQGWSWKPFLIIQFITVRLTYYVSKLFSIPVELDKVTGLVYPEPLGTLIVIPDCTAVLEMIFITALLMGFIMGFRLRMNIKKRLKWIGILCGILYIENIIRLVLNWPIAKAYGRETWDAIHIWWWKTGQLIFVLFLFFIWFVLVGKKYQPKSGDSGESDSSINVKNVKSKNHKGGPTGK